MNFRKSKICIQRSKRKNAKKIYAKLYGHGGVDELTPEYLVPRGTEEGMYFNECGDRFLVIRFPRITLAIQQN